MYNMYSEQINNNLAHPHYAKATGVGDNDLILHKSQMKWTTAWMDGVYFMADPESISRLLQIQREIQIQRKLAEDGDSSDGEIGNSFHSQTRKVNKVEQSFATERGNERQRLNQIKVQEQLQREQELYLKRIVDARNKKKEERKPTKNLINIGVKDKDDTKSAKIKKMNNNDEIITPDMQHSMMSKVNFSHRQEEHKATKKDQPPIGVKNESNLLKVQPVFQSKIKQVNIAPQKGIQMNSIVNIKIDGNLQQAVHVRQQKSILESKTISMKAEAIYDLHKDDEDPSILSLKSQQEHRIAQQMKKCERAGDQFFFQLHSQLDQIEHHIGVLKEDSSPAKQPSRKTIVQDVVPAPYKFVESKAMLTTKAILKDLNKQLKQVGMIEPIEDSRITDQRHSISAIKAIDLMQENKDNNHEILAALKNQSIPQKPARELQLKNAVQIKIQPSGLHSQSAVKQLSEQTPLKSKRTNCKLISSLVSQQIAQGAPRVLTDNKSEQKQKLNDQISILKQVINELRIQKLKYQASSSNGNNLAEETGFAYSRMDPNSERNQLSHRVSPSIFHQFAESAVSEFHTNHRSLIEHKSPSGRIVKNVSPSRRLSKIDQERKRQAKQQQIKQRQIQEEEFNDFVEENRSQHNQSKENKSLIKQDRAKESREMENEVISNAKQSMTKQSGLKRSNIKVGVAKKERQLTNMQQAESVKMKTPSQASRQQSNATHNIELGYVNNSQSVWGSNVKNKLLFNRSIGANQSMKADMESSMPRPLNKHNHSQPPKLHPQQHAALAKKHELSVKKEIAAKFDSLQDKGNRGKVVQQAGGDPKKRATKEGAYKTVEAKASYHPDLNKIVFSNADSNLKAKIIEIQQAEKHKFQQQGMGDRRNNFQQSKSSKGFRLRRGSESSRNSRVSSQKSQKAPQRGKQASLQNKSKVYVPALHEKSASNVHNPKRQSEAQTSLTPITTDDRKKDLIEKAIVEKERVKVQKRRLSFSQVEIPKIPNPPSPMIKIQEMAELMRELSAALGVQMGGEAQRLVMKKYKNCIMLDLEQSQSKLVWHYNGKLYVGEWNEAEMIKSGEGIEYIPDKYYYRGQFLKGKRSGSGLMIQCSGIFYEGQWTDGDKSGRGRYYDAPNKISYEGEWRNGKKEGFGYFCIDGQSTYQGTFVQNLKDGFGTESFHNEDSYKGEYSKGRFHGKGKYIWASGDTYEGEFFEGCKHGRGVWTSFIGEVYEGCYKLDKKTGSGKYTWTNGCVFEGQFQADKKNGNGILRYPNGREVRGVWKQGKLIQSFQHSNLDPEQPLNHKRSKVVEMTSEIRVQNKQYHSNVEQRRR